MTVGEKKVQGGAGRHSGGRTWTCFTSFTPRTKRHRTRSYTGEDKNHTVERFPNDVDSLRTTTQGETWKYIKTGEGKCSGQ